MRDEQGVRWLKARGACDTGHIECYVPAGTRLDVPNSKRVAAEIERGGRMRIKKSVSRLGEAIRSGVAGRARLRVPAPDLETAYRQMRCQKGSVQSSPSWRTRIVSTCPEGEDRGRG